MGQFRVPYVGKGEGGTNLLKRETDVFQNGRMVIQHAPLKKRGSVLGRGPRKVRPAFLSGAGCTESSTERKWQGAFTRWHTKKTGVDIWARPRRDFDNR